MKFSKDYQAFFAMVRAGLWEQDIQLPQYERVNYKAVMRLAEEQSIVGIVTSGIEHIVDNKVPQDDLWLFIMLALQIEQQNQALNEYTANLINRLKADNVYAILVKGQGIAQCYEKPLWRTSGDIDLLLDEENYEKAKAILSPMASDVSEYKSFKHLALTMEGGYVIELHGSLHTRLSSRIDCMLDTLQHEVITDNKVRVWHNGDSDVLIPIAEIDSIFVFTHILHHFYIDGVGLRQICDWCRLLYTFRETIDKSYIESIIKSMGLMSEWKAFGALAVNYLGMPIDAMPMYSPKARWSKKADKILYYILKYGSFGSNRNMIEEGGRITVKIRSALRKYGDCIRYMRIFPYDSIRFLFYILYNGIYVALKGE